jgi:hypothetical protein
MDRRPAEQARTAMLNTAQSAETWQRLMELRCRREVLERWLVSQVLTENLQQSLRTMLNEVEDQLRALASVKQIN